MTPDQLRSLKVLARVYLPTGAVGKVDRWQSSVAPPRRPEEPFHHISTVFISWPGDSLERKSYRLDEPETYAHLLLKKPTVPTLTALPNPEVEHLPEDPEAMRDQIHAVLARFPKATFVETIGTLELVKMDMAEMLKNSGPETDKPKKV